MPVWGSIMADGWPDLAKAARVASDVRTHIADGAMDRIARALSAPPGRKMALIQILAGDAR